VNTARAVVCRSKSTSAPTSPLVNSNSSPAPRIQTSTLRGRSVQVNVTERGGQVESLGGSFPSNFLGKEITEEGNRGRTEGKEEREG